MKKRALFPLIFLVVAIYFYSFHKDKPYQKMSGFIFGTYYNITYSADEDEYEIIEKDILKNLNSVNSSLSTFDSTSIISKINRNKDVVLDDHFIKVYKEAKRVSEITHGAFDLTVAPLVNIWGFGFDPSSTYNSKEKIDSLLVFCGYTKIRVDGNTLIKDYPETMLDASAIAKGYGVDVASKVLENHGVKNYLVDIGGEMVCRGNNSKKEDWHIGIDKPIDDSLNVNGDIQEILVLKNVAIATSGNYRQYYTKDGKKYSHEINPISGYPAEQNTLSTTVIAKNCMIADAYATAFMILPIDESIDIVNAQDDLEVYIIYSGEGGEFKTIMSDGFHKYIENENN